MQKLSKHRYNQDEAKTQRGLKTLRTAEALYRYELLQEERMLCENLADFWDSHFDKAWSNDESSQHLFLSTENMPGRHT